MVYLGFIKAKAISPVYACSPLESSTKAVISKRISDAEILAKAEDNIARTRVAKGLDTQEEYEQNKIPAIK